MAALLWNKKSKIAISEPVTFELAHLKNLLTDPTYKREMSIAHVVPRDPQFTTSFGDACLTGGGAFCHDLNFWLDIHWSNETQAGLQNNTIHINVMEFIVVILQLSAAIALEENL